MPEADQAAIDRCRAITAQIDQYRAAIETLAAERAELLADLDQRHTRRGLAGLVGMTNERITQILNTRRWGQPVGGLAPGKGKTAGG